MEEVVSYQNSKPCETIGRERGHSETKHTKNYARTPVTFVVAAGILFVGSIALTHKGSSSEVSINQATPHSSFLSKSSASRKPNFVFILADDLPLNALKREDIEDTDLGFTMPFVNSLASNGITLSNYYAQEVCTPSRAALMTGRYPLSVGMQFGDVDTTSSWGLNLNETTLPEVLRDFGDYKSYILGKWNLGHFNPALLPTARGFDQFLGYLDGQNFYWSKRNPTSSQFVDFLYSDTDCYGVYNNDDKNTYSTMLYGSKAVETINAHDFESNPMFLYFASQAVHDPFYDAESHFENGIPVEYVGAAMYEEVKENIVGRKRRQVGLAANVLDTQVKHIYNALNNVGQLDNTYIIFASDNGGCLYAGGKNAPLRGSKGTLFEGGVKVDAMIYSPLMSKYKGTYFDGIFHVSDWMPTMLELAGINDWTAATGFELDGVSQVTDMTINNGNHESYARQLMLYNMWTHISGKTWSIEDEGVGAIRNHQYKLLYAYDDAPMTGWTSLDETVKNDDDLEASSCGQTATLDGTFTRYLFDIANDPNETVNLYNNSDYADIQTYLAAKLVEFQDNAGLCEKTMTVVVSDAAEKHFSENGNYVQPWELDEDAFFHNVIQHGRSYPKSCSSSDALYYPGDDDSVLLTL